MMASFSNRVNWVNAVAPILLGLICILYLGCGESPENSAENGNLSVRKALATKLDSLDDSAFWRSFLYPLRGVEFDDSFQLLVVHTGDPIPDSAAISFPDSVGEIAHVVIEQRQGKLITRLALLPNLDIVDYTAYYPAWGKIWFQFIFENTEEYTSGMFRDGSPFGLFQTFYPNGSLMAFAYYGQHCEPKPCLIGAYFFDPDGVVRDSIVSSYLLSGPVFFAPAPILADSVLLDKDRYPDFLVRRLGM